MRAVVVERFGEPGEVRHVAEPVCPADGVVLTVEAGGLCRSDWHAWAGHDDSVRPPFVPGHELAGRVVEVGPRVRSWSVGDRVTAPFVLACGVCATCAAGDGQVCPHQLQPGFTLPGSFAERVALPRAETNLVRVPDAVPPEVAAGLGCRFATAYRAVALVARVRAGERVVVHGCGGVGLAAVQVAVALGARVWALDPAPASRALAADLGATALDPAEAPDLVARTDGGAEVSLDAFGGRATVAASLACLRPRGRHVQVGLLGGAEAVPPVDLGRVVALELALLGSHGMAARDYPGLLALVTDGTLRPQRLLRDRIGLDDVPARLAALGEPGQGTGGVTVVVPRPVPVS